MMAFNLSFDFGYKATLSSGTIVFGVDSAIFLNKSVILRIKIYLIFFATHNTQESILSVSCSGYGNGIITSSL